LCLDGGVSPQSSSQTVLVVPLSCGSEAKPPLTVKVFCQGQEVRAVCDQLRAIDKTRLAAWIEEMSMEDMESIGKALKQVLALS
jgi:mRNA interferase MazF